MEKRFNNIYVKRFFYFKVFVIKGKNGDILIDTGFMGMRRRLTKWLKQFDIKLIVLTHAHVDHIWNTAYLKKLYNCEVALGEIDIENLDNRKIKSKPSHKNFKTWTSLMNWGIRQFKAEKFEVDIPLKENDEINRYGIKLKIVNLGGHTNGSIGIIYKDNIFVGDALVNRKKVVEMAYQNQNNEEALKSANKIYALKPKMIFVGHDKEFSFDKLKKSIDYINKR